MRIYKVKGFARFQRRERIADADLIRVVDSIDNGLIDADLGGGLNKQRMARQGQGKPGGYRTVLVYRRDDLAVFLVGFAKNDRGNIDEDELEDLRDQAKVFLRLSREQIRAAMNAGEMMEVER
jgi:hypothetical protein